MELVMMGLRFSRSLQVSQSLSSFMWELWRLYTSSEELFGKSFSPNFAGGQLPLTCFVGSLPPLFLRSFNACSFSLCRIFISTIQLVSVDNKTTLGRLFCDGREEKEERVFATVEGCCLLRQRREWEFNSPSMILFCNDMKYSWLWGQMKTASRIC